MCGIAGFAGFKDDKLLKKFSEELKHRGPDGEGFYRSSYVSLLNRRLAIIDRAGGDQPIYNENRSVVVVYNGEIYNYRELRDSLEQAGHKFKTQSDTEVIVHGYEEWGDDCFDKFNGMFGIALYDIKKKRLVLARDHFGIKPLYYALTTSNRFMFASEIKPLIFSGLIEKKPNDKVIYRYLKFRVHEDSSETFFEGVYKLMPGEILIIEGKEIAKKYFSKLEDELKKSSSDVPLNKDQIHAFKDQLTNAVKMRLISEVPVGTCLSGGLDSSAIAVTVNKLLDQQVSEAKSVGSSQNTFSAVFPGSVNDEERYIDDVLSQNKSITSHKVYPKPEEFFEELNEFVYTQEEPTISTGPYAQYKVMQTAHNHVTVLLDGQGADEMMAGYLPYYFVYLRQLREANEKGKLMRELFSSRDVLFKYGLLVLKSKRKARIRPDSLLSHSFKYQYQGETFEIENTNLKRRLIQDIFYNSLPSLLRYEDKNAMRFSLEGRVPFLDFNLARFIFSLSDEAIIKNGWNKYVLRAALGDMLPSSVAKRRNKIGFTTPEEEWFLRMKNRIYSIFLSESFAGRPYFEQAEVVKAFQKFIEGRTDDSMLFWRILNVEMWFRVFFDPPRERNFTELRNEKIKELQIGKATASSIEADGKKYERLLVKTEVFAKGDDITHKVLSHIKTSMLPTNEKWFIVISEKIVAIAQGRSYFIWDIKPGFFAKLLSKYVTKTPFGIGLGSPWTMELAIKEVGLPRILFASFLGAATKPFGLKGIFYRVAGRRAAAIDGPTEYSLYPSNVSAKLAPKDPYEVAEKIDDAVVDKLKRSKRMASIERNFAGVAIIDANDIGRNVLGNATEFDDKLIEEIFRDNPMGQGAEQTPIAVVIEKKS